MIDLIAKLLHQDYKENIKGTVFSLYEDNASAKCKEAKFEKGDGKVIAYKFDKNGVSDKFPFFQNVPEAKTMCDFILFYQKKEQGNEIFVILCNLKSDKEGNSSKQFQAAEVFSEYIIKTLERCFRKEVKYTIKKVLFSSNFAYKGITGTKYKQDVCKFYSKNDVNIEKCHLTHLCK